MSGSNVEQACSYVHDTSHNYTSECSAKISNETRNKLEQYLALIINYGLDAKDETTSDPLYTGVTISTVNDMALGHGVSYSFVVAETTKTISVTIYSSGSCIIFNMDSVVYQLVKLSAFTDLSRDNVQLVKVESMDGSPLGIVYQKYQDSVVQTTILKSDGTEYEDFDDSILENFVIDTQTIEDVFTLVTDGTIYQVSSNYGYVLVGTDTDKTIYKVEESNGKYSVTYNGKKYDLTFNEIEQTPEEPPAEPAE
jgi:hypothetical protein